MRKLSLSLSLMLAGLTCVAWGTPPPQSPFEDTRAWLGAMTQNQQASATVRGFSRVRITFKGGWEREDVEFWSFEMPLSNPVTYSYTVPNGMQVSQVFGYEKVTGFQSDPNDPDHVRIYSYSEAAYVHPVNLRPMGP